MKPERSASGVGPAMAEHPGFFDARALLMADAVCSELLRAGTLLCPSLRWSMAGWPLLLLTALGGTVAIRIALSRSQARDAWIDRRDRGAHHALAPTARDWIPCDGTDESSESGEPAGPFAARRQWTAIMADCALLVPVLWQLRVSRARRIARSLTLAATGPHQRLAEQCQSDDRPDGRPAKNLRRGLPAFMWRLLRLGSTAATTSSPFPPAPDVMRALPALNGRGVFVLLGPAGTVGVFVPNAEDRYVITACERGLRALAVRGLAVHGGVPLIEHAGLATQLAQLSLPAAVPTDFAVPVRLMAQWLHRVAAPAVQRHT